MKWQYQVDWFAGGVTPQTNVITVESKPRNLAAFGLISVEMWTNSELASDLVTNQHPLLLFVRVMLGDSPVMDADVTVDIVVDDTVNGTQITLPPVQLFDRGGGDPDITAGDGIYSRYLTTYASTGRYSFFVTASDRKGRAFSIQKGRAGRAMPAKAPGAATPVCCGYAVDVPEDLRRKTGSFKRR